MSTTIDERVVEMRFDNKHFESNVATSMSTLEKLKQKLNLSGATKGLENLNSAAKNNNIGALGSAADTVGLRFNAMYTVADQVLRNITTRVQHTAESMVKALTLDPIKTGFQEYETQINSVQTILSNTKSKGTTIDQVNAALDELNKYADLTIYNFTEMTRNIGTFTAAGIDLDTSVSAIQGIANLAAQSGSTSQQASTAMYQLSQALATGTVKLMDWNSVVNAGMGGELFQNALKETSELLGTGAEAAIEASGSFRESLSKGWLTAEVLTETLKKFTTSGAAEYVAEYTGLTQKQIEAEVERAKATGDSSTAMERAAEAIAKMSGKSKEEIQNILEFAQDAEDAATKVKTFTQLWDVLKESAQSGWSSTWKLIIGDFEEAKNLLTPLADTLTGFINKMSDARNRVLQIALDFMSPWTAITEKLNGAGLGKIKDVINTVGDLSDKLEYYQDVVNRVWRGDYKNSDTGRYGLLDEDGYDHRIVQDLVNKGYQYKLTVEDIEASYKKFGVAVDESTEKTEQTTEAVAKLTDEQLTNAGLTEEEIRLYRALESEADRLGISMSELADDMSENNGRDMLIDSFKNIGSAISDTVKIAKGAWVDIFDPPSLEEMGIRLYGLIASLKKFTESLKLTNEAGELNDTGLKLRSTFKGIFAVLDIVTTILGGGLKIAFKVLSAVLSAFDLNILDVTANIGDAIVAFRDWLFENNALVESINGLIGKLPGLISDFKEWFAAFKETPAVQKLVTAIEAIQSAFSKLTSGDISLSEFAASLGENLANVLKSLPEIAIQIGKDFIAGFQNGIDFSVSGVIDKIVDFCLNFVDGFKEALGVQSPSWKAYETATDFFQGFINGAKAMIGLVLDVLKGIEEQIVKVFKSLWDFITDTDFFQGFINGAKAMIGSVLDVLKGIEEQTVKVFKSLWDFITDESGNVEWGKIFAGGSIVAGIRVLKQLADAFSAIAGAFSGIAGALDDLLVNAGEVMKSFSKVLNGVAWDLKAGAIQKMAISIGILVAAIWVLTTIDDPAKLWSAVGVIATLAAILVGLSVAMDKLSSASVSVNKKGASIDGLKSGLLQIGVAILLVAAAAKLIGNMDPDEAKQGFIGLAGVAAGMIVFLAAMGKIVKFSGDVSSVGTMMKKLAVVMILMIVACKLVGMLSAEDMLKGAAFAAGFAIFVMAITAVAKNAGEHVSKVGGMVLKLTIAMALMVGVCKLASLLSVEEMLKGAAFAAGFAIFVMAITAVAKNAGKHVSKVGGLVLSMSLSLMMMVGVCKLVGMLSVEEMLKGAAFVAGFVVLLKVLVSILTIGNEQKMASVAGTILAMSTAIAILAGVSVLLSFMDTASLAKGIIAVGLLSGMMTIMVKSLKGAQNAKGAILMMAITIGVMAAAVAALSFIPVEDLLPAAGAMSIMMGAFALMVKGLKGIKDVKVGPLIVLTGVVLVLAGIVALLSLLDPKSVLPNAAGLSLLLIAMSSAMLILSKTKGYYTTTFAQLQSMALVIAEVAIILGLMSFLPNPTNMIPSAIAIGILLNTLATSMLIMSKAKGDFKMSFAQLQSMALVIAEVAIILGLMSFLPNPTNMIPSAIAIGILLNTLATSMLIMSKAKGDFKMSFAQLQSMALVMAEIAVILSLMSFLPNPTNMIPSAIAIGILLNALAAACLIVSLIPAGAGIAGAVQLAAFIGIMAAVIAAFGALALIPGFTTIMEKGSEIFTIIGEAIGGFCGGIISGIGSAIISLLPQLGMALSAFAVGVQPFINLVSRLDANVIAGAGYLTGAILALSAASFISGIQKILSFGQGSLTKLGAELCAFGIQVRIFATNIKDIDSSSIDAATNVAKMILALTASDFLSTLTEKFGGSTDFESLGENLKAFGEAVVSFSDIISGEIDVDAVKAATNAGALIVELNKSLPRSGGLLQDVIGEHDLGKFAAACTAFAGCILAINAVVTQEGFELDNDKIEQLVVAGEQFNRLNTALPRTGGLAQDLAGEQDLAGFGAACVAFAACILAINAVVTQEGFELDNDKIEQLVVAGEQFNRLNTALPRSGGIAQDFAGEQDLEAFGVACKAFVSSMKTALSTMDGTTIDAEALESIVTAGNKLAELQGSLEPIGGVVDWFTGEKDLGSFGEKIASFANGMQSLSECNTINSETLASLIAATSQLSELQGSLEHVGGVIDWFIGQNDLGTFGTSVGAFASGMQALAECETINSETLASLIAATSQLSELQGSLEHIGGAIDWFIGQDDLGTFGESVATYASSMKTAFGDINGITYNEEAFAALISGSNRLSTLQQNLEHIGGVIDWFIGQDDLGTFGTSVATFASSMKTAFGDINGTTYDEEAFNSLVTASTKLSELQGSLEPIGGVIDWFIGNDDLGSFGTSVGQFADGMKSLSECTALDSTTIQNLIDAAGKLNDFQASLTDNVGGVIDWFIGNDDLGSFGTSVGQFADGMKSLSDCTALDSDTIQNLIDAAGELATLKTNLSTNAGGVIDWFVDNDDLGSFGTSVGQFADGMKKLADCGMTDETLTNVINAGTALTDLIGNLPEEGLFDGKMNLTEFSDYMTDLGTAMETFSTKAAEFDDGVVSTVINAAYRIKGLIESLVGLDVSGVEAFTGVGTGAIGADGPAYDIACAIVKFGETIEDIDTGAVNLVITEAGRLKRLIAGLVGLDTSGVEKFKPGTIGDQMKTYSDKVAGIDTGKVSSSVSTANQLKNFIAGLVDLDISGVSKFNPGKIGTALATYSTKISGFNMGLVSSSISAANRLKNFISSLAGLDSSGVSGFKDAVESLAEINLAGIQEAFDSAATQMAEAGSNIMDAIIRGMEGKTPTVIAACTSLVSNMQKIVIAKVVMFNTAGLMMMVYLSKGIAAGRSAVISATTSSLSAAASATRVYYYSFYSAGSYLVSGFAAGISANTYKAVAKARTMAYAAAQAAKNALDINSPSKVFKKIGKSVPEGFAMGIDELAGMVEKSSANMANTALDGTKAAIQHVSDMMSTDADYQPTITPVLDLSNVESGAGSIASMFNSNPSIGVTRNVRAVSALMNENSQNGTSEEIVSAINRLHKDLGNVGNTTYSINGVTYDDGSNIHDAISAVVRQARIGRRV